MLLKLVIGNGISLAIAIGLYRLGIWAGIPFCLGVVVGSFLWHIAYGLETGNWR